jgi:hypothetical protein
LDSEYSPTNFLLSLSDKNVFIVFPIAYIATPIAYFEHNLFSLVILRVDVETSI